MRTTQVHDIHSVGSPYKWFCLGIAMHVCARKMLLHYFRQGRTEIMFWTHKRHLIPARATLEFPCATFAWCHNNVIMYVQLNKDLKHYIVLRQFFYYTANMSLQWRHNGRDGVSNHQPHDCLPNRLFRRRSKKTSKLRVTVLCAGNSPVTGEFPAQIASNAEKVSIWWRHHAVLFCCI